MDKPFLEECLDQGLSLDAIGRATGRHPSTVSYWLKKYDLVAAGRARHAPKGNVQPELLREMANEGMTIRQIAKEMGVGQSTVRYWFGRLGVETGRMATIRESDAARKAGLRKTYLKCARHGRTIFLARPEGGFRCAKCNVRAVSERRRAVKRALVREAGGECVLCGFAEHPAALQFHHLDPAEKEFQLGHQGLTRSMGQMRAEAEKCVLLCANCHALVEAGIKKVPGRER
jgi:transposase-like protein